MKNKEEIFKFIPINIRKRVESFFNEDQIYEMRIRTERPIILEAESKNYVIDYVVSKNEIEEIFEKICENSVYTYKNEICEGFLTVKGGHRIGITGNCVVENGKIINIKDVSSLNIRIAQEKIGCGNFILKYILDYKENSIFNTLIASPPGCGKTTILRDTIRQLSNGIPEINFHGLTVGVVDERNEISAMNKGIPQNDIGIRTDVIENSCKAKGMKILIRSMAPKIIACDEIGSKEDSEAIEYAICSGLKGIFTAHGDSLEMLKQNNEINEIIKKNIIQRIIFLDSKKIGNIREVINIS